MKIVTIIARLLLGLIFLVFGLNGYLHFIPMPPPPGVAGDYLKILSTTHYSDVIFAFQLVAGILLLANQFVPLALAFLAPELVNILAFHFLIAHGGAGLGIIVVVLWIIVFYRYRASFAPLFARTA